MTMMIMTTTTMAMTVTTARVTMTTSRAHGSRGSTQAMTRSAPRLKNRHASAGCPPASQRPADPRAARSTQLIPRSPLEFKLHRHRDNSDCLGGCPSPLQTSSCPLYSRAPEDEVQADEAKAMILRDKQSRDRCGGKTSKREVESTEADDSKLWPERQSDTRITLITPSRLPPLS